RPAAQGADYKSAPHEKKRRLRRARGSITRAARRKNLARALPRVARVFNPRPPPPRARTTSPRHTKRRGASAALEDRSPELSAAKTSPEPSPVWRGFLTRAPRRPGRGLQVRDTRKEEAPPPRSRIVPPSR